MTKVVIVPLNWESLASFLWANNIYYDGFSFVARFYWKLLGRKIPIELWNFPIDIHFPFYGQYLTSSAF